MRRRIDHRKLVDGTLLAIETDENQHKSYDEMDDEMRQDDLFVGSHSGKWIYIRFNPDKFKNSCGKSLNPNLETRLERLKTEINIQMKRIIQVENAELIERIYLYYDGFDA